MGSWDSAELSDQGASRPGPRALGAHSVPADTDNSLLIWEKGSILENDRENQATALSPAFDFVKRVILIHSPYPLWIPA